jgi:Ni/Co efflux regulator RcnB
MKNIVALGSALLLAATASFAIPAAAQSRGSNRPNPPQQARGDHRAPMPQSPQRRDDHGYPQRSPAVDQRHFATHHYAPPRRYIAPRGYQSSSRWSAGSRLPSGYYGSSYYVDNTRYGLRAPPRGQRWVRVDHDVYLVSIASGVIASVLYGIFN